MSRLWLRANRPLLLISLASLGWAFSFGLGAPLASLWLQQRQCSAWCIGLNTSCYYLGVALAAPVIPFCMRRANRRCVLLGMLLDAATTALFPHAQSEGSWHLLRLLGGMGTAMSLIPMETLVNQHSAEKHRARNFALYAFFVALGVGIGGVVGLGLYPLGPRFAFALGGLVTLLAIPLAWIEMPPTYDQESASFPTAPLPWRSGVLSLGTAWVQGFLEGGTITFLSLYLLEVGYSETTVSLLMGGLFVGVIAAQLPLGWIADRLGKLPVLLVCHLFLVAGLFCLPWAQHVLLRGSILVLLGASCGALYPLGLALLGERVPAVALARANAWYLASNCVGSLSGPLIMGLFISAWGLSAQFALGAASVLLVLLCWLVLGRPRQSRIVFHRPDLYPSRRAA